MADIENTDGQPASPPAPPPPEAETTTAGEEAGEEVPTEDNAPKSPDTSAGAVSSEEQAPQLTPDGEAGNAEEESTRGAVEDKTEGIDNEEQKSSEAVRGVVEEADDPAEKAETTSETPIEGDMSNTNDGAIDAVSKDTPAGESSGSQETPVPDESASEDVPASDTAAVSVPVVDLENMDDIFEDDASMTQPESIKGDEIEGFDDDFKALNLEKEEPSHLGDMEEMMNIEAYEKVATSGDIVEEEASMKFSRLSAAIEEAEEENERLTAENLKLQKSLLTMFKARKSTSTVPEQKKIADSSSTRYNQSLAQWISLVEEKERIDSAHDAVVFECTQNLSDKQMRADEVCRAYNEFVREVARQSEYSRTGKLLPAKIVDAMVMQEERKEEEVRHVRLRNIQLRTQVKKLEWRLKAKEELAEGLHLIDFEQLKIENQSLNEKIEERNEELLKLRKKTTSTVQVVTHLKEKLQFVHKENSVLEETLKKLESKLSSQRDRTQYVKHELTALKTKNRQFKRQSEVVTSRPLLNDVEIQKKRKDDLLRSVNELKSVYAQKTTARLTVSQN